MEMETAPHVVSPLYLYMVQEMKYGVVCHFTTLLNPSNHCGWVRLYHLKLIKERLKENDKVRLRSIREGNGSVLIKQWRQLAEKPMDYFW